MHDIQFQAMPSAIATRYWEQGRDDYDLPVERAVSNGKGVPCRHCLADVAAGSEYLILAYRPFDHCGAYSETGPVFLHAQPCERYPETTEPPTMFAKRERFLLRAYDANHRIVYGSGGSVAAGEITAVAKNLLADSSAAYLHLRSGNYNCFQCRIDRI